MKYKANWESINKHQVPDWYDNAKLGIFIHWGLFSVPAWATPAGELGKVSPDIWFENNPYAEWYQNTLRIEGSPTWKYHMEHYGPDVKYEDFADQWKAENWNPEAWAELFAQVGAKYVVLVTKHHDGFNLWPSKYSDFSVKEKGPKRDIVGDLTEAVRKQGLRMGLYYSGILDWRFTKEPIRKVEDFSTIYPHTYSYSDYAYNQVMELIDNYAPDVLWNDIGWPDKGLDDLKHLFAYYYNKITEGTVNNRWTVDWHDFTTPEYEVLEELVPYKWEATRGLGYSFGYNHIEGPEHTLSASSLIHLLADVVSKNGNLLLNIGPKADGTIPEIQLERLRELGKWLSVNGEAIYGTRPWETAMGQTAEKIEVRFTKKQDDLYAIILDAPNGRSVTIKSLIVQEGSAMKLLGADGNLDWEQNGDDVTIRLPEYFANSSAYVLKMKPASNQVHGISVNPDVKPKKFELK